LLRTEVLKEFGMEKFQQRIGNLLNQVNHRNGNV
jgi:hypothetical protein